MRKSQKSAAVSKSARSKTARLSSERTSRVKCPACHGTCKTHSHQRSETCPWCASKGHVSRETESAFRAVKKLAPFEFTILFGGLEKNKNQERLNSWLALRKD